nr:fiber protein [Siadenovirus sp.]
MLLQEPMAAKRLLENDEEDGRAKRANINLIYPFEQYKRFNVLPPFIALGPGLDVSNLALQLKLGEGLTFDEKGQVAVAADAMDGFSLFSLLDCVFSTRAGRLLLNCLPPLLKHDDALSINIGRGLTLNNSKLECSLTFGAPLVLSEEDVSLRVQSPLEISEDKLHLKVGTTLSSDKQLDVKILPPIVSRRDGITIQTGTGLISSPLLDVKAAVPLSVENEGLKINLGRALQVSDKKLEVKSSPPIIVRQDGLALDLESSLQVYNGKLQVKTNLPLENSNGLALRLNCNSLHTSERGLEVKIDKTGGICATDSGMKLCVGKGLVVDTDGLQLKVDKSGFLTLTEHGLGLAPEALTFPTETITGSEFKIESGKIPYTKIEQGLCVHVIFGSANKQQLSEVTFTPRDFMQTDPNHGKYLIQLKGDVIEIGISSAAAYAEFNYPSETINEHIFLTMYNIDGKGLFLLLQTTKVIAGNFTTVKLRSVPQFRGFKVHRTP